MDKVTLQDQIQVLEGIKYCLEDIRNNVNMYLVSQPQMILDDLRSTAFTGEVAENYQRKYLEPDTMTICECRQRIIQPSIDFVEEQIEGLKRILAKTL